MVGRDDPGAVRLLLDPTGETPHRLQPPDVGFGEGSGCGRIMVEMRFYIVPATVRGGDLCDGMVDLPRLGPFRIDGDDDSLRRRLRRFGVADLDIVRAAIDPIDDEVMSVVDLVGETACEDATDERPRLWVRGIVDHVIRRGARRFSGRHLAMHRLDDVAALSHAPKRLLQLVGKLPPTGGNLLGQTEAPDLLQAPGP